VKVHQVHPELVRVGREMRAIWARFAFGHPCLPSQALCTRAVAR
jgi:hypothetical protein